MAAHLLENLKARFDRKVQELWGVDLRSLALFRVGLGSLLLADLAIRACDLRAHYTDFGVLPRTALLEHHADPLWVSLHMISGLTIVQAALFVLAGLFAMALLVGYRTRFATVASYLLIVSLHVRNPLLLQGGDTLLRLLVFWSMFLPLGACYSVDRALDPSTRNPPGRVCSLGTAALLMQVVFLYVFASFLKTGVEWYDGTAVYYALSIDQFAKPFGKLLFGFPALLTVSTYLVISLERFGPLLLFSPVVSGLCRTLAVCAFALLQVGLGLSLKLGLFPWINIVALFPFLPTGLWETIFQRMRTPARRNLMIYYDADRDWCRKLVLVLKTFLLLPETRVAPAQQHPQVFAHLQGRNSWVVVDDHGEPHIRFHALLHVARMSPLVWPFARVAAWRPVTRVGEAIYERLAGHHNLWKTITAGLQGVPVVVTPSLIGRSLAGFFLVYVFAWNLASVTHGEHPGLDRLRWVGRVLRIDQYWNLFAPTPFKDDGWYVIPGQLGDGTEVDLFTGGGPVRWEKPPLVSATFKNYRWRKYMRRVWLNAFSWSRVSLGHYYCRDWNARHEGTQQLQTLDIYFMREDTLPNYQQAPPKKVDLLNHWCFQPDESAPQD